MRESRVEWSQEEILRESRRWVQYPEDASLSEDERFLLAHLPGKWAMSRLWRSSATDAEDLEAIVVKAISESCAAGSRVLVWHTGEGIASPGIEPLLTARGFTLTEDLEVLAFELWDGCEPNSPLLGETGAEAEIARSTGDLRKAGRIDLEVFGKPEPSERELNEWGRELWKPESFNGEDGVALRFLAHDPDRRAVAVAGMQLVGEVGRLWGSGTLPYFRGRGAYRALVRERCKVARNRGATLALAKANIHTSAPTLRRAGFRSVAAEQRFELLL